MACTAFAYENEPRSIDDVEKKAESGKDKKMSVTNTLACSAFAEAGEPCPIEGKKR